MSWPYLVALGLVAAAPLVFSGWLWKRMSQGGRATRRRVLFVVCGGLVAAVFASALERWALGFAGLSLQASAKAGWTPALAMMLFCAPLEEALKVAVIWPLYVGRRLSSGRVATTYAVLAAGGFAAGETIAYAFIWDKAAWVDVLRAAIGLPAHFFFAGLWGYMLGGARRDRYFGIVWMGCTALHGLYAHLVFGRGPAMLVVAIPMLLMMALGVLGLLKGNRRRAAASSHYSLFDPPSIGAVREVMARKGRPLMLHWIFAGALVTMGVTLVFLGGAVYLGHQLGVDFAQVDEAGMQGVVPIALLGGALLAAFPFAAYLVARASGAVSVIEPAWSTGAAIVLVLALFSVTEPTALVIALGVAPVGFALACAGAWFGLDRT